MFNPVKIKSPLNVSTLNFYIFYIQEYFKNFVFRIFEPNLKYLV